MNKYKIEVKEILKKNIIVSAETEEKALDYIENVLLKSNILDLGTQDLDAVEAKILEKNGEKIEENDTDLDEDYDDDLYKTREELELEKYKYKLEKLEDARQDIEEILEEIEGCTNEINDILFDCFDTDID